MLSFDCQDSIDLSLTGLLRRKRRLNDGVKSKSIRTFELFPRKLSKLHFEKELLSFS